MAPGWTGRRRGGELGGGPHGGCGCKPGVVVEAETAPESSRGEASWLAFSPTKQCSKNPLWFPRNVLITFLAGAVSFQHIRLML
eukprot:2653392-Pyramimonas_sp.AAC.1